MLLIDNQASFRLFYTPVGYHIHCSYNKSVWKVQLTIYILTNRLGNPIVKTMRSEWTVSGSIPSLDSTFFFVFFSTYMICYGLKTYIMNKKLPQS